MTMQSIDSMEKSAELIIQLQKKLSLRVGLWTLSQTNQRSIFLLLLLLRGLKKYDMSICQTPKRVNLSYEWNNFLQVRNDGDFISSILDHTKDALTEILLLKTKYRIMS